MTGLVAGTRYYYVYGSEANGYSAEASFLPAEPENPHTPLNILVTADMGAVYSVTLQCLQSVTLSFLCIQA
jgi:hypothetical protein